MLSLAKVSGDVLQWIILNRHETSVRLTDQYIIHSFTKTLNQSIKQTENQSIQQTFNLQHSQRSLVPEINN